MKKIKQEISVQERDIFYHRVSALTLAGEPLDQTEAFAVKKTLSGLSKLLKHMADSIRQGDSLSDFMEKNPDFFSSYEYHVVRAGEVSGDLAGSLEWLKEFTAMKRNSDHMARIQSWYLKFVGFAGFVIFAIVSAVVIQHKVFIFPVFMDMFNSFGGQFPGLSQVLFDALDFLGRNILVITAEALLILLLLRVTDLSGSIDAFIPCIGNNRIFRESVRFAFLAGRAIEAGVSPVRAIETSAEFVNHPYLRERLKAMKILVQGGETWAAALKRIRKFPEPIIAFVSLGEAQGELGPALTEISNTELRRLRHQWRLTGGSAILVSLVSYICIGIIVIALVLPLFIW
ncbi:MAG: hypothetical protein GY795_39095 [Desulfobacterales bacterium]|nr:hypothetical protein [Desulfobacterales bacterium]